MGGPRDGLGVVAAGEEGGRRARRHGRGPCGRSSTFFLACLQLLLAPALSSAGRLLLAEGGGDGYQDLWSFWWLERALDEGRSPWHTTLLHHPFGISLQGHTLGLVNFGPAHPLLRAGVDRVVASRRSAIGSGCATS